MLNHPYLIQIATLVPFSYFIKRASIRFLFKFHVYILLALFFTFIIAVIYFLSFPEGAVPRQRARIQPIPKRRPQLKQPIAKQPIAKQPIAYKPELAETAITSKTAYKKRLEEKKKKRSEAINELIKK